MGLREIILSVGIGSSVIYPIHAQNSQIIMGQVNIGDITKFDYKSGTNRSKFQEALDKTGKDTVLVFAYTLVKEPISPNVIHISQPGGPSKRINGANTFLEVSERLKELGYLVVEVHDLGSDNNWRNFFDLFKIIGNVNYPFIAEFKKDSNGNYVCNWRNGCGVTEDKIESNIEKLVKYYSKE